MRHVFFGDFLYQFDWKHNAFFWHFTVQKKKMYEKYKYGQNGVVVLFRISVFALMFSYITLRVCIYLAIYYCFDKVHFMED